MSIFFDKHLVGINAVEENLHNYYSFVVAKYSENKA